MWTWIISIIIALVFIGSGILYVIFAPKHKVNAKEVGTHEEAVYVNNKGTSMDERKIYSIPYEDFNL